MKVISNSNYKSRNIETHKTKCVHHTWLQWLVPHVEIPNIPVNPRQLYFDSDVVEDCDIFDANLPWRDEYEIEDKRENIHHLCRRNTLKTRKLTLPEDKHATVTPILENKNWDSNLMIQTTINGIWWKTRRIIDLHSNPRSQSKQRQDRLLTQTHIKAQHQAPAYNPITTHHLQDLWKLDKKNSEFLIHQFTDVILTQNYSLLVYAENSITEKTADVRSRCRNSRRKQTRPTQAFIGKHRFPKHYM